ncbi:hypothetical protein [Microbacterium sp. A1-JK]|uniref:hypothetical protein n=1 Tax=Microbacterium sp. A1-JK TaxID=3177516 RepID=UPI003886306C
MTATATVRVGEHTIELPEPQAKALFSAITATAKKGGLAPVSPDTVIAVGPQTPISITTNGTFAEEHAAFISDGGINAWRSGRNGITL